MSAHEDLLEAVREFAAELEDLFLAVFGERAPSFDVERAPRRGADGTTRFVIRPAEVEVKPGSASSSISLVIDGECALALDVEYRCRWDHVQMYLAVDAATWSVRSVDVAEPLFRYEFVSQQGAHLPAAHLHVHAHRDELVYSLFRGGVGRPGSRGQAILTRKGLPRLSNIHFPLGGDRLRPCLEDVLQMLIEEFGVEHEAGALERIEAGRARWRRHQTGAAVRDAPETAARVLRELGYSVEAPQGGARGDRKDRLVKF